MDKRLQLFRNATGLLGLFVAFATQHSAASSPKPHEISNRSTPGRGGGNAVTLTARAYRMLYRDWNIAGALQGFRDAIQLDRREAAPRIGHSEALTAAGRHRQAAAEAATAVRLASASAASIANYGRALLFAGRYKEAVVQLRRALRRSDDPAARVWLAWTYDQLGRHDLAIEQHRNAIAAPIRDRILIVASLGCSLARRGDAPAARDVLAALHDQGDEAAFGAALVAASLREFDRAFYFLDRAIEARSEAIAFLAVHPQLEELRKDTRFPALLSRIQPRPELHASEPGPILAEALKPGHFGEAEIVRLHGWDNHVDRLFTRGPNSGREGLHVF